MFGDTLKIVNLKARNSFAYWFNIYANYGLKMLVDRNNVKRYSYPARNYFVINDTAIKISRFAPTNKKAINLVISFPMVNIFNINSINGKYKSAGIFGFDAGIDCFYKHNESVSFNIGAAIDGGFGEYFGHAYIETGSTLYVTVRNNNVIGSFDVGYGLNFSKLE